MGEGGGSVLRASAALAVVRGEPIRVHKVRTNRGNPGLRPQHLKGVRALSELCNGDLEGDEIGSEEIELIPGEIEGGDIRVEIETAGSIGLVLQTLMIPAAYSKSKTCVEFRGGATDTFFAPSVDYILNVTLPMLSKLGYEGEIECLRRGHYPKGGAKVNAEINPVEKLESLNLTEPGEVESIEGISHCVRLPDHIAKRQASSAEEVIREAGYDPELELEFYGKDDDPHLNPGTGITLWAKTQNGAILGSSSIGKKGKPAEIVGMEAAKRLINQLETGKAVDLHMTDQILPYLALAPGRSDITTTKITSHTLTNVKIIEEILDREIEVEGEEGEPGRITVASSEK